MTNNPDFLAWAIDAHGLVKEFDGARVVDGFSLRVRHGEIFGILGPNGAGKTTTLRMLLGIIEPDAGAHRLLGAVNPLKVARYVGYLPEERGLYPTMKAADAIAFMGALRGMPLRQGRCRARALMEAHGLGDAIHRKVGQLSKGMAQIVQLLGTLVHEPRLVILDEPFSGLDAFNQEKFEEILKARAKAGVTVLFSTHVIAHAERMCDEIAIIAAGKDIFTGTVDEARSRLPQKVHLETRAATGPWQKAIPADAHIDGREWCFNLPEGGVEPLLRALIDGDAGIIALSIERPSLHDAFLAITEASANVRVTIRAEGRGL